jgi:hypothetical protein
MSKRSPDPTPPPRLLKHARKINPARMIPDSHLQNIHRNLPQCFETQDTDRILEAFYYLVAFINTSLDNDGTLVSKDQFKKNADQQFLETLKRAANSPFSHEDLKALILHGMCFYFGTNPVVNII